MARIRIEDLPLVEELTPEQEALIFGAGMRSFQPTLESLENREMMDAGIGAGLMASVPLHHQNPAQVRVAEPVSLRADQGFQGHMIPVATPLSPRYDQGALARMVSAPLTPSLQQGFHGHREGQPVHRGEQNVPGMENHLFTAQRAALGHAAADLVFAALAQTPDFVAARK